VIDRFIPTSTKTAHETPVPSAILRERFPDADGGACRGGFIAVTLKPELKSKKTYETQ
jgi:hypothetical protein